MKVEYSKAFVKASVKLSGKSLESLRRVVEEVKTAKQISGITDCKKLTNFSNIYRIRMGGCRVFFNFHVDSSDGVVVFEYIVPRGQAYSKEMMRKLNTKD